MSTPLFTVFTPTYNRAHTLPDLYKSLQSQTFRDFEWLIVDDGSTDATDALVSGWIDEASFPVRYVWQENTGKGQATNAGVQLAHGDLFLTIDSDDACVPEALERFAFHWRTIQALPPAEAARYSAVTALCRDQDGAIVGSRFPRDVFDSNSLEVRYRHNVEGDKWGFQRTAVMRQFPFVRGEDGSFVPEGVVWNAIARRYTTRYVNEYLSIVRKHGDDRLSTSRAAHKHSMLGHALAWRIELEAATPYLRDSPKRVVTTAAQYAYCSFLSGISPVRQVRDLKGISARALWAAAVVPGWMYARFRAG